MGGIIPRSNESQIIQAQNPVPIRGSAVAGIEDASIADVGNSVQKLGTAIMDHYAKQQDMAQRNQYEIASSAIETAHVDALTQAKQQAAPDGSDLQQKFSEILSPKIQEIKDAGPTDSKWADSLDTFSKVALNHSSARLIVEHGAMLERYNADGAVKVADTFADSVRENPVPEMVSSRVQNYGSYIDGLTKNGTIDAQAAMKLKNQFQEKVGISYVDGLANRGSYGAAVNVLRANQPDPTMVTKLTPEEAQKSGLIDGNEAKALTEQGKTYDIPVLQDKKGQKLTPELTAAMNAIDPLKKSSLIDHYKGKAEMMSALKISELNANVSGLETIALNGGNLTDKQIADTKSQINQNQALTPFAKVRMMDQVNTAVAANSAVKTLMDKPRSQWSTVLDNFDHKISLSSDAATKADPRMGSAGADLAVQANRMKMKDSIESSASQLAKAQSSDAASFVQQADPNLDAAYRGTKDNDPGASQAYARQVIQRQNYLEIPTSDQRILPKGDAHAIGQSLKNVQNAEAANDMLTALQKKWGPAYPQVLKEIAGTDKAVQKFSAATYAPADTRSDLVDAIKNQDAINANFKSIPDHTVQEHNIMGAVERTMKPFADSVSGSANDSSRIGVVNNFRDAIALQVKREFVKGNTDVTAASEKAYNDIVGSQYNVIPSRNSSVIAPKSINGQAILPDTISNFIDHYNQVDNLKTLGLQAPNDRFGKYQKDPESFYKDIQNSGRWVTNNTQDGIKLMNVEMDGKLTPIFDKYGKQVEKKYTDIMKNPPVINFFKGGGKI